MFSSNLDDVIDPFAEEAVTWSSLSINPNSSKNRSPSPEKQDLYNNDSESSELEKPNSFQTDNPSIIEDFPSLSLNPEISSPSKRIPNSSETSFGQTDSNISFPSKSVLNSTNIQSDIDYAAKNSLSSENSIKVNITSPDSSAKAASRPILFKRNLNKTRVLLSNKSNTSSSTFIDPLADNSSSLSNQNSPIINNYTFQNSISPSPIAPIPNTSLPGPILSPTHNSYSNSPAPNFANNIFAPAINPNLSQKNNNIQLPPQHQTDISNFEEPQIVPLQIESEDEYLNDSTAKDTPLPYINISVSEPIKISDSISSHTVYKVSTKTDCSLFVEKEFVVRRRYRDFEWLYLQLQIENPGIIIPPIPEKQSFGRFEQSFIENRRIGLQTHLDRIAGHPILHKNKSFILFLESKDFVSQAKIVLFLFFFILSYFIIESTKEAATTGSSLGDLFGSSKYLIKNDIFGEKFRELELLETQLKALLKSLDATEKQREELSLAHLELGEAFLAVSNAEKHFGSSSSSQPNDGMDISLLLMEMGKMQKKLHSLQKKISSDTITKFVNSTEEYIRTVASAKLTFMSRVKIHEKWQNSVNEVLKKKKNLTQIQNKSTKRSFLGSSADTSNNAQEPQLVNNDKVKALVREIQSVEEMKKAFDSATSRLSEELERFDELRIGAFQEAIEHHLVGMIEIQDEVVGLWDKFSNSPFLTE
ncbi:Vacuolar protein sorting-associated protein vps5 [Smittium culicis]|uniref:Vacuolar protein sorting-associated protein vps5 n=1 Tax=Smittium culicis TaxID=133412 RepID=A0A1R1XU73_9FUNG|nr:Vacuolar protein sorting-associated protein vps5 [Smittium culicis]